MCVCMCVYLYVVYVHLLYWGQASTVNLNVLMNFNSTSFSSPLSYLWSLHQYFLFLFFYISTLLVFLRIHFLLSRICLFEVTLVRVEKCFSKGFNVSNVNGAPESLQLVYFSSVFSNHLLIPDVPPGFTC